MSKQRRIPRPCPPVLEGELDPQQAEILAGGLRALADPARLRLLSLIAAQPLGEACACHFTERLGLSQPTVSHHLKVLREAGVLERERRANWLYYRIVKSRLVALSLALAGEEPRRAVHG